MSLPRGGSLCTDPCMATKTISVDLEAYEVLRSARLNERESFSKVIKRAVWPPKQGTGLDLLEWRKGRGELGKSILDQLDRNQEIDQEGGEE